MIGITDRMLVCGVTGMTFGYVLLFFKLCLKNMLLKTVGSKPFAHFFQSSSTAYYDLTLFFKNTGRID